MYIFLFHAQFIVITNHIYYKSEVRDLNGDGLSIDSIESELVKF